MIEKAEERPHADRRLRRFRRYGHERHACGRLTRGRLSEHWFVRPGWCFVRLSGSLAVRHAR
jgi:hypothetical protein